jgi:hypothetical protein
MEQHIQHSYLFGYPRLQNRILFAQKAYAPEHKK